ncbi:ankyrin repeat and SOCS box protein 17 [Microdochium nivale]|nr:ankyrin repeat and SOCS box protein 17 [Microdochium nivale]
MSADALITLVENIPNWLKRLDELGDQIDQRQADLAKLAATSSQASSRSLKNQGSTESIRPVGDDAEPTESKTAPSGTGNDNTVCHSIRHTKSASVTQRETREVAATAQRRARAVVHRKEKTESMLSADDVARKYHSKTMIIVYYDSWVQSFFEELVKFVSASRNVMRKAKMAAKVAEIKRMAELEFPDSDEDEDDNDDKVLVAGDSITPANSKLTASNDAEEDEDDSPEAIKQRFLRARNTGPVGRFALSRPGPAGASRPAMGAGRGLAGAQTAPPGADIYDQLDKGLEVVQSACEQAAHQFLREGDCAQQVSKIKARLASTAECATKELGRSEKDCDTSTKELDVEVKPRVYRRAVVRHDDDAQKPGANKSKYDSGHDSGHDSGQDDKAGQ